MPAVPPRLAESPLQLQRILFCGRTYIPGFLFGFVGLCCIWLLWTRRAAARAAAFRVANEEDVLEQNEKQSGQEMGVAWLAAGQPISAAPPMYASATFEPPMAWGQRFDGAEIYPLPIRRTSYTKQFGDVSMQGEIMFGDGWTRHTRVYGGGVCLACEDSKKKQKMIMNSQGRPGDLSSPIG